MISATQGPLGGARGQYDLRRMLDGLGVQWLSKPEIFIGMVQNKIAADGRLTDEPTRKIMTTRWRACATGSAASSAPLREEAGVSYRLLSHQSGREARAGILVEEQVYDPAGILATPATRACSPSSRTGGSRARLSPSRPSASSPARAARRASR